MPSAKVREHPGRQSDRRLTLVRLALALRQAMKDAVLQIDVAASDRRDERRRAYGARPCARVERHKDEPRNVLARPTAGRKALLDLAIAPRGADEARGFVPRQPSLASRRL